MLTVGLPTPTKENERRRALLPADLAGVPHARHLVFQAGYGEVLGISDADYRATGATVADLQRVCDCDIICNPKPVLSDPYFRPGKTLFGWVHAVQGRGITDMLLQHKMTAVAWEDMHEGGRHSFWRNNEISGEAAVLHALLLWGRTPYQTRAAIVGRGNVARGSIRTLERLGCLLTVYDRKTAPLIRKEIGQFDIIVNAVLWDVFRTDHLVYEEDLARMKTDSIIIDISCDEAMGVQTSRPTTIEDPVYRHNGILHYVVDHAPSLMYKSATESISKVVARFLPAILEQRPDDVLTQATVIRDGCILDDRITRFQKR